MKPARADPNAAVLGFLTDSALSPRMLAQDLYSRRACLDGRAEDPPSYTDGLTVFPRWSQAPAKQKCIVGNAHQLCYCRRVISFVPLLRRSTQTEDDAAFRCLG